MLRHPGQQVEARWPDKHGRVDMSSRSELVARNDGKIGMTENGDAAWWAAAWLGPGEQPMSSQIRFTIDDMVHTLVPNTMVRVPRYLPPYGQAVETRWCDAESKIDSSEYDGASGPVRYDVDGAGQPLWHAGKVKGPCERSHASAATVEYVDGSLHEHVPLRYVRDCVGAPEGAASEAATTAAPSVTPPPPTPTPPPTLAPPAPPSPTTGEGGTQSKGGARAQATKRPKKR